MVFSSPLFLFGFLPVVLALYFAMPVRAVNTIALVASVLFYAWGEPMFVLVAVGSAALDLVVVRLMVASPRPRVRGLLVGLGVAANLGVIRVLVDLSQMYGRPARVRVDNGPELTAETFVEWCTALGISIGYIQPGKPDQNAFIERFNRSYREEVLDARLFDTVDQVREITDAWLEIYNTERPHESLGQVPPLLFIPRRGAPAESRFALST